MFFATAKSTRQFIKGDAAGFGIPTSIGSSIQKAY